MGDDMRSVGWSGLPDPEPEPRCPECGGPVLISSGGPICVDHKVLIGHVEPVGGSPEVERSVTVRVAIGDADMIERILRVLEGYGTVSLMENPHRHRRCRAHFRRALATPSESGTETEGRDG